MDTSAVIDEPYTPCPKALRRKASVPVAPTTCWGDASSEEEMGGDYAPPSPPSDWVPCWGGSPVLYEMSRKQARIPEPARMRDFTNRPGAYGAGPSGRLGGGYPRELGSNQQRSYVAYAQRAEGIEGKAAHGAADYSHMASAPIPIPKDIVHARSARPTIIGKAPRGNNKARSSLRPFFFVDADGLQSIMATAIVDSGATVTIVPASWLCEKIVFTSAADPCAVAWGDGSRSDVVAKGYIIIYMNRTRFRIHAWGVPEVARALISASQLVHYGAEIIHNRAGHFLDMSSVNGGRNGDRITIGPDSLVTVEVAIDAHGPFAQAHGVSAHAAVVAAAAFAAGPDVLNAAGPDVLNAAGPDALNAAGPDVLNAAGPNAVNATNPNALDAASPDEGPAAPLDVDADVTEDDDEGAVINARQGN
jgi:hypothetical protein